MRPIEKVPMRRLISALALLLPASAGFAQGVSRERAESMAAQFYRCAVHYRYVQTVTREVEPPNAPKLDGYEKLAQVFEKMSDDALRLSGFDELPARRKADIESQFHQATRTEADFKASHDRCEVLFEQIDKTLREAK
jgi:hypothetical protein